MRERTTERSAACAICGKTFARPDTLLRHQKSHFATKDRGPVHRVTNTTFRACRPCAQARSRCSGDFACGRCKSRNLECIYPAKRRKNSPVPETTSTLKAKQVDGDEKSQSAKTMSHDMTQQLVQFQENTFPKASEYSYADSQGEPLAGGTVNYSTATSHRVGNLQYQAQAWFDTSVTNMPYQEFEVGRYDTTLALDYQANFEMLADEYGFDASFYNCAYLNWIPLCGYPSPYEDLERDLHWLLPAFAASDGLGTSYDASQFDYTSQNTADGIRL